MLPCKFTVKSQNLESGPISHPPAIFGAVWKKEIASTTLIMQVKPEADFLTEWSWSHEGDQQPTTNAGRGKGRQPSY